MQPSPDAVGSSDPLHMVQLRFDPRTLARSAAKQKLPKDSNDLGYLLHGQLAALFGELAPKPFHARTGPGRSAGPPSARGTVEVLGYTPHDEDALRAHAGAFGEPADTRALGSLAVKSMPGHWRAGQRLGFELRACPAVRLSSAVGPYRKGAEIDAFLAACQRVPTDQPVSRAQVYRDWLQERFAGAATLETVDLVGFRRLRLFRRGGAAGKKPPERPDALFRGELTVDDGAAFSRLLARGIGRHRAFGFGMLLLRPPRAA